MFIQIKTRDVKGTGKLPSKCHLTSPSPSSRSLTFILNKPLAFLFFQRSYDRPPGDSLIDLKPQTKVVGAVEIDVVFSILPSPSPLINVGKDRGLLIQHCNWGLPEGRPCLVSQHWNPTRRQALALGSLNFGTWFIRCLHIPVLLKSGECFLIWAI